MHLFTRINLLLLITIFLFACSEKDYGIRLDLTVSVWSGYSKKPAKMNHKTVSQEELQSDFKQVFKDTNQLFRNELDEDKKRECNDDEACPIKTQLTGQIKVLPSDIGGDPFFGVANTKVRDALLRETVGRYGITAITNIIVVKDVEIEYIDPVTNQKKVKLVAGLTRQDHGGIFIGQDYLHRPYNTLAHELGHLLMNYDSAPRDLFDDGGHLKCGSSFNIGTQSYTIDDRHFLTGCKQKEGKSNDYILFHSICQYMLDTPSDVRNVIKNSGGNWEQVEVSNDAGRL